MCDVSQFNDQYESDECDLDVDMILPIILLYMISFPAEFGIDY